MLVRGGILIKVVWDSGVNHLEEIEAEGFPVPAVNQIEASRRLACIIWERSSDALTLVLQLHPYCQQKVIVDYCKQRGIAIEAYSPLVRGQIEEDAIKEIAASKVSFTSC